MKIVIRIDETRLPESYTPEQIEKAVIGMQELPLTKSEARDVNRLFLLRAYKESVIDSAIASLPKDLRSNKKIRPMIESLVAIFENHRLGCEIPEEFISSCVFKVIH